MSIPRMSYSIKKDNFASMPKEKSKDFYQLKSSIFVKRLNMAGKA